MILITVLFFVFIALGVVENFFHKKHLESIPIRILVNGTRGKTTVCRMLVKALNDKGIRTVGRTTGSDALQILPDGKEIPVNRRKSANIIEMVSFFRFAYREKAECVVVECMALGEENQKTIAKKLVKPTITVIVNSYVDHIGEIGKTKEETIRVLSKSVGDKTVLFATESEYESLVKDFHLVNVRHFDIESNLPIHDMNVSIIVDVLSYLGLTEEEALKGAIGYSPDIGLIRDIELQNGVMFINSFSVNDPKSMHEEIERALCFKKKLNLIFNSRMDREYRILSFEEALRGVEGINRVYIIGNYKKKVAFHVRRKTKATLETIKPEALFDLIKKSRDEIFLGLGNIKGDGEKLVEKIIPKGGDYAGNGGSI